MQLSRKNFGFENIIRKTEGRSFCICPLVYTDINKGTDTKGPSPQTLKHCLTRNETFVQKEILNTYILTTTASLVSEIFAVFRIFFIYTYP